MKPTARILLVALGAGVLGLVASLAINGPGPLLRTELGQRALHGAMEAGAPPPPADLPVARRGEPLPPLTLPRLDGTPVTLPGAYAGRPVLINLWATWCGPCRHEMPELDRFARAQGPHGTRVVGIALDDPAAVRAFLQQTPVGYPILIDTPGPRDAGARLGDPKGVLPYSVLLGPDGRVLKQRIGQFETGELDDWAG